MTTIRHDHGISLCVCGAVVAQCRCLADDNPRRVVVQQCFVCTGMAQAAAAPNYEARFKTMRHIEAVRNFLGTCIEELVLRARTHDQSKLQPPEVATYDRLTASLRGTTYGTPGYYAQLQGVETQAALAHHYAHNAHHPEHFPQGVRDMTLIDLLEMVCDWKSSSLRHNDGSIEQSLTVNQERFGYGDELQSILRKTLNWLESQNVPHHAHES